MSQTLVNPIFSSWDDDGVPLSGGKLYTYTAFTSTLQTTYSDRELTTPRTNPIIFDSRGEISGQIYFEGSLKIVLKDSEDVTIWTVDDVRGMGSTVIGLVLLSSYSDIHAAITDIGSDEGTLLVDVAASLSTNLLIPENVTLMFVQGMMIDISGYNLTIAGSITGTPAFQIFDGADTGTVDLTSSTLDFGYAEWWGIDGTADDVEINYALVALGTRPVRLLARSYTLQQDGSIYLSAGQSIQGVSRTSSLVRATTWSTSSAFVIDTLNNDTGHRDDIYLSNFKIQGPGGAAINGIGLNRSSNSIVERVTVANIGGKAFVVDGSGSGTQTLASGNVFRNCLSSGTHTHGFVILGDATYGADENEFDNCKATSASTYAFQIGDIGGSTCSNNRLEECTAVTCTNDIYVAFENTQITNFTASTSGTALFTSGPSSNGTMLTVFANGRTVGATNQDPHMTLVYLDDPYDPYSKGNLYGDNESTTDIGHVVKSDQISFAVGPPGTISISPASGSFEGFADTIAVVGSASNDGVYTVASSTATTITLVAGESLVLESAGNVIQISSRAIPLTLNRGKIGAFQKTIPVHMNSSGDVIFRTADDTKDGVVIGNGGSLTINNTIAHGSTSTPFGYEYIVGTATTSGALSVDVTAFYAPNNLADVSYSFMAIFEVAATGDISGAYSHAANCHWNATTNYLTVYATQPLFTDMEAPALGAVVAFVGGGTHLVVRATGVAGQTIRWIGTLKILRVY